MHAAWNTAQILAPLCTFAALEQSGNVTLAERWDTLAGRSRFAEPDRFIARVIDNIEAILNLPALSNRPQRTTRLLADLNNIRQSSGTPTMSQVIRGLKISFADADYPMGGFRICDKLFFEGYPPVHAASQIGALTVFPEESNQADGTATLTFADHDALVGGVGSVLSGHFATKGSKREIAGKFTNNNRLTLDYLRSLLHFQMECYALIGAGENGPGFLACGAANGFPHVIMGRPRGARSLLDWSNTPRTPPQRLQMAYRVVDRLGRLHHTGFVHRDLKPDNILVDESENAILCDFGFSYPAGRKKPGPPLLVQGTPGYMAPETYTGDARQIDFTSDIFSLGCVLFGLATAQDAFSYTMSEVTIEYRHPEKVAERLPQMLESIGWPPEANRFMTKLVSLCLIKEPHRRPQNVEELMKGFHA